MGRQLRPVMRECSEALGDAASEASTELASEPSDIEDTLVGSSALSAPFSSAETLFIFDWDDTLLPTTWLQRQGFLGSAHDSVPNREQLQQLELVAAHARATVAAAMRFGRVVIVTNAAEGWVEWSCSKFMPSFLSTIEELDVVAASAYEGYAGSSPTAWKRLAFEDVVNAVYGDAAAATQRRNIISLGDALYEQKALESVTRGQPHSCGKSVKLMVEPCIHEFIAEHEMLGAWLQDAARHCGDLDLEIATEPAPTDGHC
mmetsp:Transcript_32140/g.88816  ORF Transcript_32140/g.88816 Transcript_32140/m.88816 type:complete len:260 (+) Transcript_32140:73-852(+)